MSFNSGLNVKGGGGGDEKQEIELDVALSRKDVQELLPRSASFQHYNSGGGSPEKNSDSSVSQLKEGKSYDRYKKKMKVSGKMV